MDLNFDLDQVLVLDLVFMEIAVEHLEIFAVPGDREALNVSFRSFPFNLFKDFCSEFSDRAESIRFDQCLDWLLENSSQLRCYLNQQCHDRSPDQPCADSFQPIMAVSLDHLSFWTHKR